MELFKDESNAKLYVGDVFDIHEVLDPDSIESIIADPDNSDTATQPDLWSRCYQVLKPGGHLLVFGGTAHPHRITCAVEDAGFEIRDCIIWMYGNSANATVHPGYEPIVVARKPCEGSCIDNVLKYGVGGINIDACRVMGDDTKELQKNWVDRKAPGGFNGDKTGIYGSGQIDHFDEYTPDGRFPSNIILTYDDSTYQEVCGNMPDSNVPAIVGYDDSGCASRYFYCAKITDKDSGNIKPCELFQYLIRMVTPQGGKILAPFHDQIINKACVCENEERQAGYTYIGISPRRDEA